MLYGQRYFYVALTLLILGVLFRQLTLVSIGVLGSVTLLIAWGWQKACLANVTYERRFAEDHLFWGESVGLDVTLTNFKLLPLSWLEADEVFPKQLEFAAHVPEVLAMPREILFGHTTAMRWFERVHWHYELGCRARGLYQFQTVTLRSGDMFGLFTREAQQPVPARLYVYPKLLDLPALGLPPRHPFGDLRAHRQLLEDPLRTAGVREYRPEDPFKRVHWKATARTQQLQVRVYDSTTAHTIMLFLNIETWTHVYEGVDAVQAEWAIVVAASLARYAAGQQWSFGLHSNAPAADGGEAVHIAPSHSPEQLIRLLEGLARMVIYPVRGFTEILRTGTQSLPIGSTIVVISAILSDDIRSALLRLRERGQRVVVCALGDERPAPLPRLLLYHLPPPRAADYLRAPQMTDLRRYMPGRSLAGVAPADPAAAAEELPSGAAALGHPVGLERRR
ncbi:MAG TPA: DUF58 domain-containing protein [Chloroflexia bacterium]|nr:DUF58 domain-containing protein [Chloroflexia bacterium]